MANPGPVYLPDWQQRLAQMSHQQLQAFLTMMQNEAANPPKVDELIKIPDDIPPGWQVFFEKIVAYHRRICGSQHGPDLISLEKRSWIMEDKGLSELEMMLTALELKKQVW